MGFWILGNGCLFTCLVFVCFIRHKRTGSMCHCLVWSHSYKLSWSSAVEISIHCQRAALLKPELLISFDIWLSLPSGGECCHWLHLSQVRALSLLIALNAITSEQPRLHSTGDDLPEPEKLAVVQVIVHRRKRKTLRKWWQKQPQSVQEKCHQSYWIEQRSSGQVLTVASSNNKVLITFDTYCTECKYMVRNRGQYICLNATTQQPI